MTGNHLPLSFIILGGSLVLNFVIPYLYFFYTTRIKKKSFEPYRAIDSYLSGMIGDAICVPLINLFFFKSLYGLPVPLSTRLLEFSFVMGVFVMATSHAFQAIKGLINWSMPEPWNWTFPGKYHMVSATIQYSFLSLMVVSILGERSFIFSDSQRFLYLASALFFVVLFLLIFAYDYTKGR